MQGTQSFFLEPLGAGIVLVVSSSSSSSSPLKYPELNSFARPCPAYSYVQ